MHDGSRYPPNIGKFFRLYASHGVLIACHDEILYYACVRVLSSISCNSHDDEAFDMMPLIHDVSSGDGGVMGEFVWWVKGMIVP
eukprot:scaffold3345_cov109-Alexandrium_tamarense.AAC.1